MNVSPVKCIYYVTGGKVKKLETILNNYRCCYYEKTNFISRECLIYIKTASLPPFPIFSRCTAPIQLPKPEVLIIPCPSCWHPTNHQSLQSLLLKYLSNQSIFHYAYHHYSSSGHHCLLSKLLLQHPYGFPCLVLHFPRVVSMVPTRSNCSKVHKIMILSS